MKGWIDDEASYAIYQAILAKIPGETVAAETRISAPCTPSSFARQDVPERGWQEAFAHFGASNVTSKRLRQERLPSHPLTPWKQLHAARSSTADARSYFIVSAVGFNKQRDKAVVTSEWCIGSDVCVEVRTHFFEWGPVPTAVDDHGRPTDFGASVEWYQPWDIYERGVLGCSVDV